MLISHGAPGLRNSLLEENALIYIRLRVWVLMECIKLILKVILFYIDINTKTRSSHLSNSVNTEPQCCCINLKSYEKRKYLCIIYQNESNECRCNSVFVYFSRKIHYTIHPYMNIVICRASCVPARVCMCACFVSVCVFAWVSVNMSTHLHPWLRR